MGTERFRPLFPFPPTCENGKRQFRADGLGPTSCIPHPVIPCHASSAPSNIVIIPKDSKIICSHGVCSPWGQAPNGMKQAGSATFRGYPLSKIGNEQRDSKRKSGARFQIKKRKMFTECERRARMEKIPFVIDMNGPKKRCLSPALISQLRAKHQYIQAGRGNSSGERKCRHAFLTLSSCCLKL